MMPGRSFSLKSRPIIRPDAYFSYYLMLIAFASALLIFFLVLSYRQKEEAVKISSANESHILASQLDTTLRRIRASFDLVIENIFFEALSGPISPQQVSRINRRLNALARYFPEIHGYQFFDTDGQLVFSSELTIENFSIADQEYFQQAKVQLQNKIQFSETLSDEVRQAHIVVAHCPVFGSAGEFRGIIAAPLNLSFFEQLFAKLDIGAKGMVSIRRSDNSHLVVRWPRVLEGLNKEAKDIPPQQQIESGVHTGVVRYIGRTDAVDRIFAFHSLPDFPFYVLVGREVNEQFAEWYKIATMTSASTLMGLLLLGLFLHRLKASEASLSKSEARYQTIVENLQDLVCRWLPDTTLTFTNKKYLEVFGPAGDSDLVGRRRIEFIPLEEREGVLNTCSRLMKEGGIHSYERSVPLRDGTIRHFHWIDIPILDSKGKFVEFQSVGRDITERKEEEETVRKMVSRRQREADVVSSIAGSKKLADGLVKELAMELNEAAARAIEVERVGVWLFEEGETRLVNIDNFIASTGEHSSGALLLEHEFQSEFAILLSAKYVDAHDALTDPRTAGYVEGYLKPNHITSMLDAVIRFGGKNLGTLCFEHVGKPHHWEDDEITFACQLADQIALAISNRERKQAEIALQEEASRRRILFEQSRDGIVVLDQNGKVFEANQRYADMLGYTMEELLQLHVWDWDTQWGREELEEQVRAIGPAGDHFETLHRRKDGSIYNVEISSNGAEWRGEKLIYCICRDVSERKASEEAIRASEEKHRTLFETMVQGVVYQDSCGAIIDANPAARKILGLSLEQMQGRTSSDPGWRAIHEDGADFPGETHPSMLALETGKKVHNELMGIYNPLDGNYRWINIHAVPQFRSGQTIPDQVYTIFEDITERKRSEQALIESEEKYRKLLEDASDAIFLADAETGMLLEGNQQATILTGWSSDELKRMHQKELHPGVESGPCSAMFREHLECPGETKEALVRHKDGKHIPVEITASTFTLNGRLVVQGIFRDVTARRRAEDELRESELFSTQIQKIARLGGWKANPRTDYLKWTEGVYHIVESPRTFKPTLSEGLEFFQPEYRPIIEKSLTRCLDTGEPFTVECEGVTATGKKLWAEVRGLAPVVEGESSYVMGTFQDITERKLAGEEKERLESQLRHSQKLEAIGTLAGGIAHDFNNILSPIIGYTEMAMDGIPESSPLLSDLGQVLTAANRAKELVQQILSFSRVGEDRLIKPVDIGILAKEALKLLRASLPSSIQINQDIHKAVAMADATQIHQVIVNLCTNAAQAMGDKGVLGVSLRETSLSHHDFMTLSIEGLKPGSYARLTVSDTGHGMDEETIQRIFDPYFTTKEVGKGTGLGLAVVHGIVKRHGGVITVRSEPEKGTIFTVFIPSAPAEQPLFSLFTESMPRGSEHVLLIDDEQAIAELGSKILERQGYRVTVVTTPREALDLFASSPYKLDLIITDYTMPTLTGIDLAREMLKIRPEMPIILCTGFNEKASAETIKQTGIRELLMKPFDRGKLTRVVRDVLDGKKG